MNRSTLPANIQHILTTVSYANLATCGADMLPLSTPLFVCTDDELNMYWSSDYTSRHAQDIKENKNVALTVYDSTAPEGKGVAYYASGWVQALEAEEELLEAMRVYKSKYFVNLVSTWSAEAPQRLYKFTPEHIWQNSESTRNGAFIDVRKSLN